MEGPSVPLQEYIEAKLEAMDKAQTLFMQRLDERLESMNQFRDDLRRQAATFKTIADCGRLHAEMDKDIRSLRESRAELAGKASQLAVNVAILIGLLGLVVGLLGLLLK